jgi:uncharacterized protein
VAQPSISIGDIERRVTDFCEAHPDIVGAFLFGSARTGRMTEESDIDVAFLFDTEKTPTELFVLQGDLTKFLGIPADLVDLGRAPVILRAQIFRKGKCVLSRDNRAINGLFVRTVQEYADVKRMRKPVEDALIERTIHG